MTFREWAAWRLDWQTWLWIGFIVYFVVAETITRGGQQLTNHLRPVFLNAPVIWFIGVGLWLWLGIHLLWPPLEAWLLARVGGY